MCNKKEAEAQSHKKTQRHIWPGHTPLLDIERSGEQNERRHSASLSTGHNTSQPQNREHAAAGEQC